MAKKKLLQDIKTRPPRFYRMPGDVARDRRFTDDERLEILRAWAEMTPDETLVRQIGEVILEIESRRLAARDHAAE